MESSRVYDEKSFYSQFLKDLLHTREKVIIESPFLTIARTLFLKPTLAKIIKRGIRVYVITRPVEEQCDQMQYQAEKGIDILEEIGVSVITQRGYLHRKLAIIDEKMLWQGSLNLVFFSSSAAGSPCRESVENREVFT